MRLVLPLAIAALVAAAGIASAQTVDSEEHRFQVQVLAEGFSHPWGLAFLPDGRMLVTERGGRLNLLDANGNNRRTVEGTPSVATENQGGLLDVILHPDFEETPWVYLSYARPSSEGNATAVGRGLLDGEQLTDFEVLFVATPYTGGGRHFGSRMAFDEDGYLYISTGDRGQRDRSQELDNHYGKIIRLTDDGQIPDDNPFLDQRDAQPGIYSYGLRNPQGMIRHPETGEIWINEHGPRGGDEINIIGPGLNYGWPKVTHGREYHGPRIGPESMDGMEDPLHHWTPSIAPSGFAYYDADVFPAWQGNLFVGALAQTHLARLVVDNGEVVHEERLLDDAGWRIRDVRQGPDGALYLLVDQRRAPLVRLSPAD
ncbi:glucose/arabinose dehydrogenase [Natronocella acetinitrilica]|uniref:Glucose/arabinose dehydrogenase n=1 Tax=Natronocella acetinitrilica TaxID=414046 RepID=A0AAE3G273_9GAMM|nr:PQQ-dependent sugar dehydrogenase [Natronocella acetinitrilica]MCP1674042.1 glucose/arabinose dehydrogenase [Natronocella acetinitrilica]